MKAMEKVFVVDITLDLDETAEFADVILPESSYLERFNLVNLESDAVGLQAAQPAVEPIHDTREGIDILIDLADRSGCLRGPSGYNALLNGVLQLSPPHRLNTERRYSWEEILDIWAQCRFGKDRGLEWFKTHGRHPIYAGDRPMPLPDLPHTVTAGEGEPGELELPLVDTNDDGNGRYPRSPVRRPETEKAVPAD